MCQIRNWSNGTRYNKWMNTRGQFHCRKYNPRSYESPPRSIEPRSLMKVRLCLTTLGPSCYIAHRYRVSFPHPLPLLVTSPVLLSEVHNVPGTADLQVLHVVRVHSSPRVVLGSGVAHPGEVRPHSQHAWAHLEPESYSTTAKILRSPVLPSCQPECAPWLQALGEPWTAWTTRLRGTLHHWTFDATTKE